VTRTAWRLIKTKYLSHAFDGEGARVFGGRWNSPGRRVTYVSESQSLAALEVLVHLQDTSVLPSYSVIRVTFDEALVTAVDPAALPKPWRRSPPSSGVQAIGDAWLDGASSAVLEVPSAVVDGERNYLINPAHPDFHRVVIDPPVRFEFDSRLLRRP
jgi:RES domain-containing protein